MKKLMVMFAAVALAGAAQAAYVNWGMGGSFEDPSGNSINSIATAFFFYGTVTTDPTANTYDLSQATQVGVTHNLKSQVWSESSSKLFSGNGGDPYSIVLVNVSLTDLDGYSGDMVVVTGTTSSFGLLYATSSSGIVAGDWQNLTDAAAVPEPTSGLLLLVGGALLALRRKRA